MKEKTVALSYSKKTKKFQYSDIVIGGPRYVKDEIASILLTKLPPRFKTGFSCGVYVGNDKKSTLYVITKVA